MTDVLGPASTNAVVTRPTRTISRGADPTWFRDCSNPALRDGTILPADFLNDVLAQLRTAFANSGITLDNGDDMLWRAMQAVSTRYAEDSSGAANAIVAAFDPPVTNYGSGGLMLAVKVANNVTGATTVKANALSTKALKKIDGADLVTGDLPASAIALMMFDGVKFQLLCTFATAPALPPMFGRNLIVISSSQSWTVPASVTQVYAQVWGAAGGGGASHSSGPCGGGGGDSGGYSQKLCTVTPGANISVTIGAGGAGGAGNGANGVDGGSSSFGAYCAATGGKKGLGGTAGGLGIGSGVPGVGSGGDLNLTGSAGKVAVPATPAIAFTAGGNGGDAPYLGGGGQGNYGTGIAGGPGAGGAGGGSQSGFTNAGGKGGDGLVILSY